MTLEVETLTGAEPGAPSPDRINQRNGLQVSRQVHWTGRIEVRIPKLRKGSCFPGFQEPRRMAGKALTAAIQEVPYPRRGLDPIRR
jgi:putative transposase